jgi:hypothetical protein
MNRLAIATSSMMLLIAAGCIQRSPRAADAAAWSAAVAPRGPVIVHLVGQHQTITVTAGPDGPLYNARTTAGLPIVANATLKELREQHPEVYRVVEPTMAVHADIGDAVPDHSKPLDARGSAPSGDTSDRMIMLDSRR